MIGDDEGNGLNANRVCRLRVDGIMTFRGDEMFVVQCNVQEVPVLSCYASVCDARSHAVVALAFIFSILLGECDKTYLQV